MPRRFTLLSLAVAALAIPAAPAVASTTDGYVTPAGVSQTQVSDGSGSTDPTSSTSRSTSGSTLPFTGLDVGLMLAGGVVLLGGGLGLKRFTGRVPERH
jgi:hypothetical protein